jgi:hypothetical protein
MLCLLSLIGVEKQMPDQTPLVEKNIFPLCEVQ